MAKIIEISNLSYSIGKTRILGPLDLGIESGEFAVLLGENGAGKTTLVDLLMGFRKPETGQITISGEDATKDPHMLRQRLSYLSERVDLPGEWSVKEFLEFNRPFYQTYDLDRERELIDIFKIDVNGRVGNLSAGQLRRAQIVAGLSTNPQLILVDEITAVLDITGRIKFMGLLKELTKCGSTVLLATNILEDLHLYSTRLILLKRGRLVHDASESEISRFGQSSLSSKVASILEAA